MRKPDRLLRNTVEEFNKTAKIYDNDEMYDTVKIDYAWVVEQVKNYSFSKLVDCGCGTGNIISMIAEMCPDKEYIGIDITGEMLKQAKKKLPSGTFIEGNCESVHEYIDHADTIICVHSFHHYPHPKKFFENTYAVLNKGGHLILCDNGTNSVRKWLRMNCIEYPRSRRYGSGDYHYYHINEIRRLCKKVGYNIEKLEVKDDRKLYAVLGKVEN